LDQHSHSFAGYTTYEHGHIHHYGHITDKAPSGVPHRHSMEGETTYNHEHDHEYETETGPVILLPNGLHYHNFRTKVSYEHGHIHYIKNWCALLI